MIDALLPTTYVPIDGQLYGVRHPDGLTILQHRDLMRMFPRYQVLISAAERSASESEELAHLATRLAPLVVEAPPDVVGRLSDLARLRIVAQFVRALAATAHDTPAPEATATEPLDWLAAAARLGRFYPGTSPLAWLTATPIAVFRACLAWLPRLEAEESLLACSRVALGSGTLAKDDRQTLHRAWMKQASPPPDRARRRRRALTKP
jgi:hypothetical protein